jgi:two-component system cell cycle response regulator
MKVLVIDDDSLIQTLISNIVDRQGCEVIQYDNAKSALDYIKSVNEPLTLILDWMMPDMDGMLLCELIRSSQLECQPFIILFTSKSLLDDEITALNSGADLYLTKPVEPKLLMAYLKVAKRFYHQQQQGLELQKKLIDQATKDTLTKVDNRRSGLAQIKNQLSWLIRQENRQSCITMMDIDHFKDFNDDHGHACGDEVLYQFCRTIELQIRPFDIFCRYGGEEFLIFSHIDEIDISNYLERLRLKIENINFEYEGKKLSVTASFGAVCFKGEQLDQMDEQDLINIADEAMYEAKKGGRNRAVIKHI